jgi:hypothetical protein
MNSHGGCGEDDATMNGERRLGLGGMLAIVLALLLALAPAAFAQIRKDAVRYLTPSEAQAAMFGIDMRGTTPSFGFSWRECITPRGDTLYQVDDVIQRGKLRISPEGWACFAYSDTDYKSESCFAIRKRGDGFVFEGEGGSVFVTTRVDRGVKACEPEDERVS